MPNGNPTLMTLALDLSAAPANANGFLERTGLIPTYRGPSSAIQIGALRAVSLPLPPGLPRPEDVLFLDGQPAPDRVAAAVWPPNQGTDG